jgi:hypothetical protein
MDIIKQLFDENGNCQTLGDPYRDNPRSEAAQWLFDDDGYLDDRVPEILREIINERNVQPMCDAVQLLIADTFAGNTKGNYSTIFYYR